MSGGGDSPLIVVVDDERELLELVELRLTMAGYRVLTAEDGDAGLELIRESRPALAILDVRMPGLDGYELTRVIRDDPELRGMKVVMLSASVHKDEVKKGMDVGADDHLKKPFKAADLLEAIARVLDA